MIKTLLFLLLVVTCQGMTEKQILYYTLMGEARGEGKEGILAVSNVIVNRYNNNLKYKSISEVCLEDKQFSFWNDRALIEKQINVINSDNNKEITQFTANLVNKILNKEKIPNVLGKNVLNYCRFDCFPKWRNDNKIVAKIKNHVFFACIK